MNRSSALYIDLNKVESNIKTVKKYIGEDISIVAVVKANAYGHGIVEISRCALSAGVDTIGVATFNEALLLREHFPVARIFIMGHTLNEHLELAVKKGFILTIFSLTQARLLNDISAKEGRKTKVHIKVDTGFNRLGIKGHDKVIQFVETVNKLNTIDIEGIFSHLALLDEHHDKEQYHRFNEIIGELEEKGIFIKYKHICDSISAVDYPKFRQNMVRLGAIIYGLKSFKAEDIEIKQAIEFKTKISYIKDMKKGEGISYNLSFRAPFDMKVATLPFGYADGYPRNLSNLGFVKICGKKASIVGIINMDQLMVDVTGINCQEGDEVIIYSSKTGSGITIDDIATLAKTNKNDIVSRLNERLPRVYRKGTKEYVIDGLLNEYKK